MAFSRSGFASRDRLVDQARDLGRVARKAGANPFRLQALERRADGASFRHAALLQIVAGDRQFQTAKALRRRTGRKPRRIVHARTGFRMRQHESVARCVGAAGEDAFGEFGFPGRGLAAVDCLQRTGCCLEPAMFDVGEAQSVAQPVGVFGREGLPLSASTEPSRFVSASSPRNARRCLHVRRSMPMLWCSHAGQVHEYTPPLFFSV